MPPQVVLHFLNRFNTCFQSPFGCGEMILMRFFLLTTLIAFSACNGAEVVNNDNSGFGSFRQAIENAEMER